MKSNFAKQPEAPSSQQQEFYSWLRRLPFDFLEELYRQYTNKKNSVVKTRRNTSQKIDLPQTDNFVQEANTISSPSRNIIRFRRSIFFLIATIIGIELLFDFFYACFRILPMVIFMPQFIQNNLAPLYLIIFIILNVLKIIFILIAALRWMSTRFEIRGNEVRFIYGIFFTKEKIYVSTYAQEVICNQSFLGRIFNFGTVEIHNPVLKEVIYLDSIPNPHDCMELIKERLPIKQEADMVPIGQSP